jgi:hypothetical protein
MSYDLTNELLRKGAPCHWTPSVSLTYLILASRYHDVNQRAYPGLEGLTRVTNLKRSAQMKNISQLKKEGWIIQLKRGQTGQRAEYKVLFIESDLYRCQCITPCRKQVSTLVTESLQLDNQQGPMESVAASSELHPKRRTKLTNRTTKKIDQERFDFVISKIPLDERVQISSGSNYESLLDELIDVGIPLTQIRDFLGSQNWTTSNAPGGLLQTILKKYLIEMSKPKRAGVLTIRTPANLTNNDQLKNALASFSRNLRLTDEEKEDEQEK